MENPNQEKNIPLHHAQKEIIYSEMSSPLSAHTNVGGYVKISGLLDVGLFMQALHLTIESFDIFKISFYEQDTGDVFQQLGIQSNGQVVFTDLSSFCDEASILDYMQERFNLPYKTLDNDNYDLQLIKKDNVTHYWLLRFNHAVQDGAGISPIVKKCAEYYNRLINGEAVNNPDCVSFINEVKSSETYIGSEKYEKDKGYWVSRFQYNETNIFDYSKASSVTKSHRIGFFLEDSYRQSLYQLCKSNNISIQNVYMAAIGIYVNQRYDVSSVPVGTVVHNRNNKRKRGVAGMLSGNLATSIDIRPEESAKELISTIKRQQRADFRHQSFPISHLQNILGENRLFEIMFNYQPLDFQSEFGTSIGSTHYLSSNNEHHPLQIRICDYGENQSMECIIDYRDDCLDETEARRIYQRVTHIANQLISYNLDVKCKDIQIYTDHEIEEVGAFSSGEKVNRELDTVASAIRRSARYENTALTDGDNEISFKELAKNCNKLARLILDSVDKEKPKVAICMHRSISLPQIIYSVILAGGSYIPIETSLPQKRVNYIIENSEPDLIICDRQFRSTFDELTTNVITIDDGDIVQLLQSKDDSPVDIEISLNDACYIIYTSGTTGEPKGVVNEHDAVVNRIAWMQNQYDFSINDKLIQKTPYGFDVSAWEFLLPVFSGATLFIAKPEGHRDIGYLIEAINHNEITTVHFVPSMLSAFLANDNSAACHSLKRVICSGEALPLTVQNAFLRTFPHCRLYNLYGPTEAAIDVTHWECILQDDKSSVPIGYPIDNVDIFLLDQNRNPVPVGVPGELYIGGVAPARGYLNKTELTREKFIRLDSYQMPVYRSGDLACWLPNGAIEYLGRIDDQVKIRGLRIELSEVEHVIRKSGLVSDCAVCALEEQSGSKKLVAFAVKRSHFTLGHEEWLRRIKEQLTSQLPEYMIPASLLDVACIPLSKNGKADKKALVSNIELDVTEQKELAKTDFEKKVSKEIAATLNREQAYLEDNFFSVGGDSILALKLIARLKKIGLSLKLNDILREPLIRSIIANTSLLTEYTSKNEVDIDVVNSKHPTLDTYLTSDMQSGVIFHSQRNKGSGVYHDVFTFIYDLDLEISNLQSALDTITEQNEILRTCFELIDGKLCQFVLDDYQHRLQVLDHESSTTLVSLSNGIETFTSQESSNDFDFMTPPFRVFVHKSTGGYTGITFSFHLSILDGWSIHSLNSNLISCYLSKLQGMAIENPEKPRYKEFIKQEKQISSSPEAIAFWKKKGEGYSSPVWIDNNKTSYTKTFIDIDKSSEEKITRFANIHGVHEREVYLAIHFRFIAQMFGSTNITSSVVMNGRPEIENSDLTLGQFLCSPPLIVDSANKSGAELLSAVKKEIDDVYPYRYFPLSQIQKIWDEKLSIALFNYVNFHVYQEGIKENALNPRHFIRFEETNFLVETNVYKSSIDDGAIVELVLDDQITDNVWGTSIEALYQSALAYVVGETKVLPSTSPCVSGDRVELPSTNLIELFVNSCRENMELDALIVKDKKVSYAALYQRVSAFSSYLSQLGIGRGDYVAIMMERSENLVYAIYAIMQAGAAYIPIDPAYPEDRIRYMLSNSGQKLVLCDQENEGVLKQVGMEYLNVDSLDIEALPLPGITAQCEPGIAEDDPCYMIYTSGTTGQPKGVINSHASVVNRILWMQRMYQLTPADRVLQKTPYSFDVSVWEFLWPLFFGSTLVVAKPNGHMDVDYLIREITEKAITTIHFVPSMLEVFTGNPDYVKCTSLTRIFCSGEALSARLQDSMLSTLDAGLYNLYGPTEAAIDVTHWECNTGYSGPSIPIGYPIDNVNLYILNNQLEEVPSGVPGELAIGGLAVAKAYHNKEQLTAEKFVRYGEDRIYRTGDLVRLLPCGAIEYMGRIDEQVKINGQRIELAEIASAMMAADFVVNAAAMVCRHRDGRQFIAAYYVAGSEGNGAGPDLDEMLLTSLSGKLPAYMLPSYLKQVSSIPLSPSGKLNRKALPVPSFEGSAEEKAETPIQQTLVDIFKSLTLAESVGINDDFFVLGGDSLAALRLVSEAAKHGLHFSINDIYHLKTVRWLSAKEGITENIAINESRVYPWLPNRSAVFRQMAAGATLADMNHWTWSSYIRFNHDANITDIETTIRMILDDCQSLRMSTDIASGDRLHNTLESSQIVVDVIEKNEISNDCLLDVAVGKMKAIDLIASPISFTVMVSDKGVEGLLVVFHHLVMDNFGMGLLSIAFDHYYDSVISHKQPERLIQSRLSEYAQSLFNSAQQESAAECEVRYANLFIEAGTLTSPGCKVAESNLVSDEKAVYRKLAVSKEQLKAKYGIDSVERLVSAVLIKAIGDVYDLDKFKLELRNHGRKSRLTTIDVSATVGYFSESIPLTLTLNKGLSLVDSLNEIVSIADELLERHESFGIHRYMSNRDDVKHLFSEYVDAEVAINVYPSESMDSLAHINQDRWYQDNVQDQYRRSGNLDRVFLLDIKAECSDGSISISLGYNENTLSKDKVLKIMDITKAILV